MFIFTEFTSEVCNVSFFSRTCMYMYVHTQTQMQSIYHTSTAKANFPKNPMMKEAYNFMHM